MPRETVDQWDFSPGKPLGNLLPTKQDVLGVPRWPQVIYLAFMSVFPVSHFVLFGCFRSVIVLACICIFFCVVMSFFTSLRYEIVLLLSLHFFVAMVLGLLFMDIYSGYLWMQMDAVGHKWGLRNRKETGITTDTHCGTRPQTTRSGKRPEIVEGSQRGRHTNNITVGEPRTLNSGLWF